MQQNSAVPPFLDFPKWERQNDGLGWSNCWDLGAAATN
jgi:hypothetical protein